MEVETVSSDSSTLVHHHRDMAAAAVQCEESGESSSSPPELELGLALSLGCGNRGHKNVQIPRILTANELNNNSSIKNVSNNGGGVVVSPPSSASSSLALKTGDGGVCVGSKRAASPTALSQVVGWPPIRSYRMNTMANQAKSMATSENNAQFDETNKGKKLIYDAENNGNAANAKDKSGHKSSLFVKVNMDGVAIGRKVDLASHSSYVSLARTLEEMFTNNDAEKANAEELILMPKVTRPSKLLDGTSDFVITYEDKDGDWMLVGDVPWGMFVTSVKRLKIMRTSEANGLTPRSEDRSSKQKRRPI